MKPSLNRRTFMSAGAASVATLAMGALPPKPLGPRKPVVISSGNEKVVEIAMEKVKAGADPLDAAIEGVAYLEADPNEHTVGYGGTPNEDGVVELDAAVMHGPTHGGGAVAALRNIMHPAAVARVVMQRTKHVLIVGENALKFAKDHGFPEVNLLTEDSRKAWMHWKESRLRGDSRIPMELANLESHIQTMTKTYVHGTIHCSVLDSHGDLGCVTSTSGVGYKVPGRVGDSPILGAGLYLDNTIGSCGSVGLGEVNLLNCSSFLVVEYLRRGMAPKDALVEVLKRIHETTTRDPRFRDDKGKPNFGVSFFCLTKEGKFAAANMRGPMNLAVCDGHDIRTVEAAMLFE